jgi:hypothetical protein
LDLEGYEGNHSAMKPTTSPLAAPRLYALAFCAAQAGLTPDTFLQACIRKEIPVSVLRIGERGRWKVDAIEFLAWMQNPPQLQPLSNLF